MASPVDADYIADLFSEFGPVSVRRMFGGAGIFADGSMIGIISNSTVFLKGNDGSVADFEREGCGPFTYGTKDGQRSIHSYWKMPERLYDDPGELAQWARIALQAACDAAAKSPRKPVAAKKAKSSKPTKKPVAKAKRRRRLS